MKRYVQLTTLALFLGCLLLTMKIPVRAAVSRGASDVKTTSESDAAQATPSDAMPVIAITYENYDINDLPSLKIIQNNTQNLELLLATLQNFEVTVTFQTPDGLKQTTSTISWNIRDLYRDIDPYQVGKYQVAATIDLFKDGNYLLPDHLSRNIMIPVEVMVPSEPVVVTFENPEFYDFKGIAVTLVDDVDLLKEAAGLFNSSVNFYEADGTTIHYGSLTWDTSTVDIHTPGIYTASGVLHLPMHTALSPDSTLPPFELSIIVQEPGKPELYDFSLERGRLVFPWIIPEEDTKYLKLWISRDNGTWEQMPNSGRFYYDAYGLHISQNYFDNDSAYRLQVDYKDGRTGILSLTFGDTILIQPDFSGDRDGGDSDGNPPLIGSGKPVVEPETGGNSSSGGDSSSESESASGDGSVSEGDSDSGDGAVSDGDSDSGDGAVSDDDSNFHTNSDSVKDSVTKIPEGKPDNTPNQNSKPDIPAKITQESVPEILPPENLTDYPVTPVKKTSTEHTPAGNPAPTSIPAETAQRETYPEALLQTETTSESTFENMLPTISVLAVLTAILSLLFLMIAKRRNNHDVESP